MNIFIGNTRAGQVYNFSTPLEAADDNTRSCKNCHKQQESQAIATGQVLITNALLKDIQDDGKPLESLRPAEVEAYLREHLVWTVTAVSILPIDEMMTC